MYTNVDMKENRIAAL